MVTANTGVFVSTIRYILNLFIFSQKTQINNCICLKTCSLSLCESQNSNLRENFSYTPSSRRWIQNEGPTFFYWFPMLNFGKLENFASRFGSSSWIDFRKNQMEKTAGLFISIVSSFCLSFLKVGNSPKMSPTESEGNNRIHSSGSWRQAILNRVVTPGKDQDNKDGDKRGGVNFNKNHQGGVVPRRTKQELRELWRKAINQQVILIRMEKENTRLRGML